MVHLSLIQNRSLYGVTNYVKLKKSMTRQKVYKAKKLTEEKENLDQEWNTEECEWYTPSTSSKNYTAKNKYILLVHNKSR